MSFILKAPASGTEIILEPDYSYIAGGKRDIANSRSISGALFSTPFYVKKTFSVKLFDVTSSDNNQLQQWFIDRENLVYTENNSITPVDNGYNVKLIKYDLNSFPKPYSRVYIKGSIQLEEYK